MSNTNCLESAMERIRRLECPTADVSERVAAILSEYGVADAKDIEIGRQANVSANGAQIFHVTLKQTGQTIIFEVITGAEDYVAKVADISEIK